MKRPRGFRITLPMPKYLEEITMGYYKNHQGEMKISLGEFFVRLIAIGAAHGLDTTIAEPEPPQLSLAPRMLVFALCGEKLAKRIDAGFDAWENPPDYIDWFRNIVQRGLDP